MVKKDEHEYSLTTYDISNVAHDILGNNIACIYLACWEGVNRVHTGMEWGIHSTDHSAL